MDILQLRYFCHAAETQNFAKTAEHFFVAPSGISQAVKRLEEELGKELFDRTSNRIRLNEAGRFFHEKATLALNTLEEAKSTLLVKEGERPVIRILALNNRRVVALAAERFSRAFPDTPLFFSYQKKEEDDYDMIISDTCPDDTATARLPLLNEPFALAFAKARFALSSPLTADALQKERFVCMPRGSSLYDRLMAFGRKLGFTPTVALESDDPATLHHCIETGVGIGLIPAVSWHGRFSAAVSLLPLPSFTRTTYLYTRPDVLSSPTKKAFAEILHTVFQEERNFANL